MTHSRLFRRPGLASLVLGLCTLLALVGPAASANQLDVDQKINISLKSADLVQTLSSFAVVLGAEPEITPGVAGQVTIDLEGVPWIRAIHQICDQHRLNCELLQGEPTRLRVRPIDAMPDLLLRPGLAQNINLALRSASVREVLASLGTIGEVEINVADEIEGSLSINIQGAPWPLVLDEACDLNDCQVLWNERPIRVVPAEVPSERRVSLKLQGAARARVLALVDDLDIWGPFGPLVIEGAELLRGKVSVDFDRANWTEVLEALCHMPDCTWKLKYGSPSRLQLKPGDPSVSIAGTVPTRLTEGLDLTARLTLEGQDPTTASLRFTWASPLAVIRQEETWVHLGWLPFGPDRQIVLPALMRCDDEGGEVPRLGELLELGRGDGTSASHWSGVGLELAVVEEGTEPQGMTTSAPCRDAGDGRVVTQLLDSEGKALGRPVSLGLPSRIGTYLMIAPAGRGSSPAAAILNLGRDSEGQHLALVYPEDDGFEIEELVVVAETPLRRTVPCPEGELTLEMVHRPR